MKRVFITTVIFIVSLVGVVLNTVHSYLFAAYGGSIESLLVGWAFFIGGFLSLWFFARTRSIELLTLFVALVFRSVGQLLFYQPPPDLGIPLDLFTRVGLFFLLSGVGFFGIVSLYFEDSLLVRREIIFFIIPLCTLFVTVIEPINIYRPGVSIFPVYLHNANIFIIALFGTLVVGILGMVKIIFSNVSFRYNIVVPAYILQSVLWGTFLFPLPLWLNILLIPLFWVSIFFYSREIEEFYQP